MNDVLGSALNQLDAELAKRKLSIEIVICGAYALHLFGYSRSEHTFDVDSITQLRSIEIKQIISDVGEKFGLGPSWLNDQASTVSLPNGVFARATPIKRWGAIKASVVSRLDLIKMKASAFSIRRDHTNKDWEDLVLLNPIASEIEEAILFINEANSPPANSSKRIISDFKETIDDLRKIIK